MDQSHSFEVWVEGCCPSRKVVKKNYYQQCRKKGQTKSYSWRVLCFSGQMMPFWIQRKGGESNILISRNLHRLLMKNVFHFTSAQSAHTLYELLVFVKATEWKNTANNFPLHFVSQSFQIGYYNKDKGNCQASSSLFLWNVSGQNHCYHKPARVIHRLKEILTETVWDDWKIKIFYS